MTVSYRIEARRRFPSRCLGLAGGFLFATLATSDRSLPFRSTQFPPRSAVWALQVMEERNIVPASYFKKLEGTEDIWECRGQHGTNTFKILDVFRRPRHPRAHARIHQEEPKDAGKGNREGGELQEGFPVEEKGP